MLSVFTILNAVRAGYFMVADILIRDDNAAWFRVISQVDMGWRLWFGRSGADAVDNIFAFMWSAERSFNLEVVVSCLPLVFF